MRSAFSEMPLTISVFSNGLILGKSKDALILKFWQICLFVCLFLHKIVYDWFVVIPVVFNCSHFISSLLWSMIWTHCGRQKMVWSGTSLMEHHPTKRSGVHVFYRCQCTTVETVRELTEFAKNIPGFVDLFLNDQVSMMMIHVTLLPCNLLNLLLVVY